MSQDFGYSDNTGLAKSVFNGKYLLPECYRSEEGMVAQAGEKYKMFVPKAMHVDLYDIAKYYGVTNNAAFHAFKKILMAGRRGGKDKLQDLTEALESLQRAIELEGD